MASTEPFLIAEEAQDALLLKIAQNKVGVEPELIFAQTSRKLSSTSADSQRKLRSRATNS